MGQTFHVSSTLAVIFLSDVQFLPEYINISYYQ